MKTKINAKSIREIIPNITYMLRYVIRYSNSFIIYRMAFVIVETFSTYVNLNMTRWILDTINVSDVDRNIIFIICIGITLMLSQAFTSYFNNVKHPQISIQLSQKIYEETIDKIKRIDQIHFEEKEFYNMYSRALNEIDNRAENVVTTLCRFISVCVQSLMIISIVASIDYRIMLVGLLTTAIGTVIAYRRNKLTYKQQFENTQNTRERNYIKRVVYQPEFTKDLKFHREYNELLKHKYNESTDKYRSVVKHYSIKIFFLNILNMISNILFIVIIPCIFIIKLLQTGSISVSEASILINSANILPTRIGGIFYMLNDLYNHSLYIKNFRDLMEYKSEIEVTQGIDISGINELTIENLSFCYNEESSVILNDININIKKGTNIAIAGYNGSGKSTLAKLILRLYDPTTGNIKIDNINISEIDPTSLRNNISILNQDFKIYSFSIAENILMKPLAIATQHDLEKVIAALKNVGLYDKVAEMPETIYTNITKEFNDNGVYLSGGELQRLAIARAIAADTDCIILDEPDNSLDPINQNEIFEIIFNQLAEKTLIIISHKMSLIRKSDYIFFLSEQHIISEHGTHDELMAKKGEYYRFYTTQALNFK